MPDYRSTRAREIVPYVAGEQSDARDLIKLNTNENPYPPAPGVAAAIQAALPRLPLYPPADGGSLRRAIAQANGLETENVFVGNGSDEVLALSFLAFFDAQRPVRIPELTYSFYPVYADLFGVPCHAVPMGQEQAVDVDALLGGGAVVLANPNAPTAIALDLQTVERIAKTLHARGEILLVDEAYVEFGAQSALPLLARYDNVLIVRTFSKSHSLAGLRIGYALGHPGLICALLAVKDSFNSYPLDHLAIAAGTASIEDAAYHARTLRDIMHTREEFTQGLRKLGFVLNDSSTNFVFARHPGHAGKALYDALRERNILVRHFNRAPIADYLRITIGTPEQMQRVLEALAQMGVAPCV